MSFFSTDISRNVINLNIKSTDVNTHKNVIVNDINLIKEARRKGFLARMKQVFKKKKPVDLFIADEQDFTTTIPPQEFFHTIVHPRVFKDAEEENELNDLANTAAQEIDAQPFENKIATLNIFDTLVDECVNAYHEKDDPKAKEVADIMKQAIRRNAPVVNKPRELIVRNVNISSISTQTDSTTTSTSTDDLEAAIDFTFKLQSNTESFKQVDLQKIKTKLIKNLFTLSSCKSLTYYLKCKYAFAPRTPTLLAQMRTDARVWMSSKDYELTTDVEYQMLTTSVLAAFMIDPSEYAIYQLLSDRNFWNASSVYNTSLAGNVQTTIPGWLWGPSENWRGHSRNLLFPKKTNLDYTSHN